MALQNDIIIAPISIYDVQRCFGRTYSDIGSLIIYSGIKKWAKYKPVRLALIDTTGQLNADNTWKNDATWWKATNGNCGITFGVSATVAQVKSAIDDQLTIWAYQRPQGGTTNPFRLIDFNHYNHNVPPPIYGVASTECIVSPGQQFTVTCLKSLAGGDNLVLSDIGQFDNFRFTIAIYLGSTLKLIHSSEETMGDVGQYGDIQLTIPYNDGVNGGYQGVLEAGTTYTCYVFLSSVNYSGYGNSVQAGTYIPLPYENFDNGIPPFTLTPRSYSQWMRIEADCSAPNSRIVNWKAYMYNSQRPATISLIDNAGNIVPGQSRNIDFNNGSHISTNPDGWLIQSSVNPSLGCEPFLMPAYDPESYRVKMIASGMPDAYAYIGHDIQE